MQTTWYTLLNKDKAELRQVHTLKSTDGTLLCGSRYHTLGPEIRDGVEHRRCLQCLRILRGQRRRESRRAPPP